MSPQQVRSIEGVTEYRLPNGLQILLAPDAASPTVELNLTYKVGSRHEGHGESGSAHLLEHLNFKGTDKHPDIPAEMAAQGAEANAFTTPDATIYFQTLPVSGTALKWALELDADRMVNSRLAQQDLDSEMTVVRNEYERKEDDGSGVLHGRVLQTAYLWHGYGQTTIGARSHAPPARHPRSHRGAAEGQIPA